MKNTLKGIKTGYTFSLHVFFNPQVFWPILILTSLRNIFINNLSKNKHHENMKISIESSNGHVVPMICWCDCKRFNLDKRILLEHDQNPIFTIVSKLSNRRRIFSEFMKSYTLKKLYLNKKNQIKNQMLFVPFQFVKWNWNFLMASFNSQYLNEFNVLNCERNDLIDRSQGSILQKSSHDGIINNTTVRSYTNIITLIYHSRVMNI